MASELKFQKEARNLMAEGIKKIYEAVRVTLGPKGRNVIIEQAFGPPLVVSDGATIAKNVSLANKYENLGASLIIEAATKTNDLVGDGTTTAIILASTLILEGLQRIDSGVNPVSLSKGLKALQPLLLKMIEEYKVIINQRDCIFQVATNASKSIDIGKLILSAYDEVGTSGLITILEAKDDKDYLEVTRGYGFDRGYVSPYLITNQENLSTTLDQPLILITNKKITTINQIVWALEIIIELKQPLLIICESIEEEVLTALIVNNLQKIFHTVVVRAPSSGTEQAELLTDLSFFTGAILIDDTFNAQPKIHHLGRAAKVIIEKEHTTIIDGAGNSEKIEQHLNFLSRQLKVVNEYEQEKIKKRMAKLSSGIALIKVGAPTEAELKEKKLRFEDALNASRAALEEGIVEGGGKVFYQISESLSRLVDNSDNQDDKIIEASKTVLRKALQAPFYQLLDNGGYDASFILSQISDDSWFDCQSGTIVNFRKKGIIDPTLVLKTTLINAISIASLFLTTECAIVNIETNDKNINEENLLE